MKIGDTVIVNNPNSIYYNEEVVIIELENGIVRARCFNGETVRGPASTFLLKKVFKKYDPVQRPSHYAEDRKFEPIDVIEDWFPEDTPGAYHKGSALKYMSRAGRKPGESEQKDLEKAIWYLQRRVKQIKDSHLQQPIAGVAPVQTSSGQEPSTDT